MKKTLLLILIVLLLCGCNSTKNNNNDRYLNMIQMIKDNETFNSSSEYFDINGDIAKIENGYRFYIIIDNPRVALYNIEAIAVEEGIDYTTTMAANVGIFEDIQYNMIPNQSSPEDGFVEGIVISGITDKPNTSLYVYVQFNNIDYSVTHNEYFKIDVNYE